MKKAIVVLTLSMCVMGADLYAAVFSDDFESGTLSQWTIEGRRAGRASTAGTVTRHDSRMAYLYQNGFTEVCMSKTFSYQEDLRFSFDMEMLTYSEAPDPDSASYASAGVIFSFLDNQSNELGLVRYVSPTSTYPVILANTFPNKHVFTNDGSFAHYSLDAADLLSCITIDHNALAFVKMQFASYTSGDNYSMRSHNWIDNVLVTPEPASAVLMLLGSAWIAVKRKR